MVATGKGETNNLDFRNQCWTTNSNHIQPDPGVDWPQSRNGKHSSVPDHSDPKITFFMECDIDILWAAVSMSKAHLFCMARFSSLSLGEGCVLLAREAGCCVVVLCCVVLWLAVAIFPYPGIYNLLEKCWSSCDCD